MLYTVAASESIAGSRTAKIAAFSLSLPAIADFDGSKKDNHQESLLCGYCNYGGGAFLLRICHNS
ncbi:hypothetical protein [Nostoc sp.]|uniref:hypothetical protein n=1 Tax=Nostoc sp. TaxID=1180 RepID=UPI002FF34AF2